jgi:hypothetical protein
MRIRAGCIALFASGPLYAQTPPAPGGGAPAAAAPVEPAPVEVSVRGVRDLGASAAQANELRDIPGTFGDPFQAVAALPGVIPVTSGLPYFYVRGAPPADTGYYIDGVPLPTLFHIGPGPSVVPAALIDRIELFAGAAPAEYGRFAGGIIAGETARPADVARGEASVRLFDASAMVETPVGDSSSVLAAGRYGYPNALLSLLAPGLSLAYGDYTFRGTHKLNAVDTISVLALGSYDTETDASQELTPVDTLFHRVDVRLDHTSSHGSIRVATTLGYDRTATDLTPGILERLEETSVRVRVEAKQWLASDLRLEVGGDASGLLNRVGTAPLALQQIAGGFAEVRYLPSDRIELSAGVRADAYATTQAVTGAVDPRISLKLRVSRGLSTLTTLGVSHQPPTYFLPIPGLRLDPSAGLQTVYQYSEGVELRLPLALSAIVTGFYDADRNTNDFASDCGIFAADCNGVARVDGSTYGLEATVRRAFSQRLAGWVSYTLSRAERHIGSTTFLSPFDRTHVIAAVVRYDFGAGVDVGVRATYDSGRPDIPAFTLGGVPVYYAFGTSQAPQMRLPEFYRIDVRAEKRWTFGAKWLAVVAEMFNATLTPEAVQYKCEITTGRCTAQTIGPIALPSLGVEGGF